MFCKKGKCDKCKHYIELIMEHTNPAGKASVETVKKCVLHHMLDIAIRTEIGQIRVQAAVEHSRNQKAEDDHKASTIMATGFVGLLHAFNEDKEKFHKSLKLLNTATKPKGQIQ